MSECGKEQCCSQQECCHAAKECCHGESKDPHMEYFFQIADEAWEEVLKDKIKEYLLSTQNDKMTELAKIVAEGNNQRWRAKMEKKHGCMEFKEKIARFFGRK